MLVMDDCGVSKVVRRTGAGVDDKFEGGTTRVLVEVEVLRGPDKGTKYMVPEGRLSEADPCRVCGEEATKTVTGKTGGYMDHEMEFEVCEKPTCTFDEALSNYSEAAYEASLSDYYGGSGPVTVQEQYEAAHAEREALRRGDK